MDCGSGKQKSELWPLHPCSVAYLTGWHHWRAFTLLDFLFIKITDQIRKPALWVQALNQAGNIALQLLLTQQEIHRSFSLHKPACQERTIVNSFWFFQELLLVSAATPVLPLYRAVQSELCTALSGCSSEIPGWPVRIMIYLQCFVYSHYTSRFQGKKGNVVKCTESRPVTQLLLGIGNSWEALSAPFPAGALCL